MGREDREPESKLRDEQSLLRRLRAGDETAFAELVHENAGRLLAVARRLLRSEEDARDALQDAFLQAFRAIGRFQGESRLSTWLHRIVINACLMKLRTQRRHPEDDIEQYLPKFKEDGHQVTRSMPWCETPESLAERAELCTLVREAIDMLPDSHRVVLLLRDIEELSTEEAAEALGITPNALKVRLHRARQALRALLDPRMRTEVQ